MSDSLPQSVGGTLVGYARCSTAAQDLTAQQDALRALGVKKERIYLDRGLTAATASVRGWVRRWPRCATATRSWSQSSTGSLARCHDARAIAESSSSAASDSAGGEQWNESHAKRPV